MIKEAIEKVVSKQDLTYDEAYTVMNEIMNGETSQVQNAAYLAALSTKSAKAETIDEISGSAAAMRDHALKVAHDMDVLEIVGTGGDHAGSINISTTAAFLIAAAGIKVAKHGNRAASSKSGAADCLEALGINISLAPETCVKLLKEINICFLFAQKYHASMKYVGAVRKELGIRTLAFGAIRTGAERLLDGHEREFAVLYGRHHLPRLAIALYGIPGRLIHRLLHLAAVLRHADGLLHLALHSPSSFRMAAARRTSF